MFNPLSIVLNESSSIREYIQEASSVKDIYNDNVEKLSSAVVDAHETFLNVQRKIMEKIRGKKVILKDLTVSQLASRKLHIFSGAVSDILQSKVTDNSKTLLKYIKKTQDQIFIIKKMYKKSPVLGKELYASKGVGFKTTTLPTQEEYIKAITPYKKAWKELDPLQDDELFQKFNKPYRSRENLMEDMFEHIDYYFKPDTNYQAKEYVDLYDDMNKDMMTMLSEHKKRYGEIRRLLTDIHDQCTKEYNEDLQVLEKFKASKEEKDAITSVATHNYKILSDSIMFMIDMVSVFHRIQLQILCMSYENYRTVIQLIYDDLMVVD